MISLQEVNEKYRDVLAEIGNIDRSRGRGHRRHHAWCWQ